MDDLAPEKLVISIMKDSSEILLYVGATIMNALLHLTFSLSYMDLRNVNEGNQRRVTRVPPPCCKTAGNPTESRLKYGVYYIHNINLISEHFTRKDR